AVPDELRDGEAALSDVRIERPVRNRALGRHEVHGAAPLDLGAEVPELRNLVLADAEVALGLEINGRRVLHVERVELGRDLAPDTLFFRRVLDEGRAERLEAVL